MFPTMLRHDTCSHNTNTHDTDCDTHCDTDCDTDSYRLLPWGFARPGRPSYWESTAWDRLVRCSGWSLQWVHCNMLGCCNVCNVCNVCNCSFKLNWFEWTYVRKTLTTHSQGTFAMRSCSPSVFLEQASSSKQFPMSWAGLSCLAGCNRLGGPWLLHVIPGNWPDMALSLPVISPKMDNLVLDLGVCDVSLETEHVMLLWCSCDAPVMLFDAFLSLSIWSGTSQNLKTTFALNGIVFFCVCACVFVRACVHLTKSTSKIVKEYSWYIWKPWLYLSQLKRATLHLQLSQ